MKHGGGGLSASGGQELLTGLLALAARLGTSLAADVVVGAALPGAFGALVVLETLLVDGEIEVVHEVGDLIEIVLQPHQEAALPGRGGEETSSAEKIEHRGAPSPPKVSLGSHSGWNCPSPPTVAAPFGTVGSLSQQAVWGTGR